MQKSTLLALIYALFLLLLCTDLALFTFAREWHVRFIAGEDRATEWLTFTFFLGAALAGVGIVRKHSARMDRRVLCILLGLAVFYLVCAGEELSWGQRVFGFATPEAIVERNQQQEFNIHNLKLPVLAPARPAGPRAPPDLSALGVPPGHRRLLPLCRGGERCAGPALPVSHGPDRAGAADRGLQSHRGVGGDVLGAGGRVRDPAAAPVLARVRPPAAAALSREPRLAHHRSWWTQAGL